MVVLVVVRSVVAMVLVNEAFIATPWTMRHKNEVVIFGARGDEVRSEMDWRFACLR